jgi:hypothetical protein
MKNILILFFTVLSFSTNAQTILDSLKVELKKANNQRDKATSELIGEFYQDATDTSLTRFVCEDHCPKFCCKKHLKQCTGQCNCLAEYRNKEHILLMEFEDITVSIEEKITIEERRLRLLKKQKAVKKTR